MVPQVHCVLVNDVIGNRQSRGVTTPLSVIDVPLLICINVFVCVRRSKRHKSGSMEEEVDSPGGEYYHSPSSPASSSRNWTDDMEGGNRIRTS